MKRIILLFLILLFTACNSNNPIIGKWKTSDKYTIMKDITFEKDKYITMGMHIKCDYEIENNKVIVTDISGIGGEWKIIDNNTISMRDLLTGKEIIYKKYE